MKVPVNTKIEIERLPDGDFDVRVGNRSAGPLTLGEMLEVVVSLATPGFLVERRCLDWLKTDEQKEQDKANRRKAAEARAVT